MEYAAFHCSLLYRLSPICSFMLNLSRGSRKKTIGSSSSSSSSSRIYYFDREGPTDVAVLLQGTLSALYRAKQKRSVGNTLVK